MPLFNVILRIGLIRKRDYVFQLERFVTHAVGKMNLIYGVLFAILYISNASIQLGLNSEEKNPRRFEPISFSTNFLPDIAQSMQED